MNEVQHYKEHRDQQWSAWVICDWAKLVVAIRFVQEAKRLNQMHSYIREEDIIYPPEFYAISDSLKEPQSCMNRLSDLYHQFRVLLYLSPTLKFSTSMVLNHLRDVLVFDIAREGGYAEKKEFRKRVTSLLEKTLKQIRLLDEQPLHVEQLIEESKETSLPDAQPCHVGQLIQDSECFSTLLMMEESKFVQSWSILRRYFPYWSGGHGNPKPNGRKPKPNGHKPKPNGLC